MWRITYEDTRTDEFVVLDEIKYYSQLQRTLALLEFVPFAENISWEKI